MRTQIIPPVRIRKTAVAPADGDSFAAKIQIIHPSRVPAADYFKNTNSPVYPGHGFVETPKPLPSIKSFIENKVSKLNEDKSRVKPTIKPHPSAVKLFHAKHNVQVNEVANEGGFAVRGNSLPPLYSNVCGNTKDVEKNVKSPVSEVKDNFVWNGWVAEIGKTDGLKSSK
jgi:hypothetical protein